VTPLFIASGFAPPKTLAPEPTKPAKQQVEGGGGGGGGGDGERHGDGEEEDPAGASAHREASRRQEALQADPKARAPRFVRFRSPPNSIPCLPLWIQGFTPSGCDLVLCEFAASEAKCLKRGVKEVVKSIRRGNKGLALNLNPSLFMLSAW